MRPVEGRHNHYEIAETIANPYGFVGREILEQMRLRPAGARL
jgi:hypothetical protein